MIKNHFSQTLILAYVISFIFPASAQQKETFSYQQRATYEVTYLADSLDRQSEQQFIAELLIGDNHSLFRSSKKAYSDSLMMEYINNKVMTMSTPIIVPIGEVNAFNYQVLKDFSSGTTRVYDEAAGSTSKEIAYYVEPDEAMATWVLKNDTSTIEGHLCQRADIAFGGRNWIAWFSLDLSAYTDGPYKFKGLPGLIFRVYDTNKLWDFSLKGISKVDTLISINFREGLSFVKTTKEQLYKERRDFQKRQIEIREASGSNFGVNKRDMKARLEEYIAKDNNWIKLYP